MSELWIPKETKDRTKENEEIREAVEYFLKWRGSLSWPHGYVPWQVEDLYKKYLAATGDKELEEYT